MCKSWEVEEVWLTKGSRGVSAVHGAWTLYVSVITYQSNLTKNWGSGEMFITGVAQGDRYKAKVQGTGVMKTPMF